MKDIVFLLICCCFNTFTNGFAACHSYTNMNIKETKQFYDLFIAIYREKHLQI